MHGEDIVGGKEGGGCERHVMRNFGDYRMGMACLTSERALHGVDDGLFVQGGQALSETRTLSENEARTENMRSSKMKKDGFHACEVISANAKHFETSHARSHAAIGRSSGS